MRLPRSCPPPSRRRPQVGRAEVKRIQPRGIADGKDKVVRRLRLGEEVSLEHRATEADKGFHLLTLLRAFSEKFDVQAIRKGDERRANRLAIWPLMDLDDKLTINLELVKGRFFR